MNMHSARDAVYGALASITSSKTLNYFIASAPEDHSTQNLCCSGINTDLEETLFLTFFEGRGSRGSVDISQPVHHARTSIFLRPSCRIGPEVELYTTGRISLGWGLPTEREFHLS
jgi:hypothetical protein